MAIDNSLQRYIKEYFKSLLENQQTLNVNNLPRVLHEPAIQNGYRQMHQPWQYYIGSLFQVHNETVNVWTHLLGFFVVWILLGEYSENYDFLSNPHLWPMLVLGICCMVACLTSSCVHLIHSKSPTVHYHAFMIDYVGATIYAFGTGVVAFYSFSDKRVYDLLSSSYMPMLLCVSWLNFVFLCIGKVKYGEDPYNINRKFLQVGAMTVQAFVVTIPFGPRYWFCWFDDSCSLTSLNHLTIIYILFILQAFFFGSHMPEKLFPGKCDILGHGHQIFHVLCTLTQAMKFRGIMIDYKSGASGHTDPDLTMLLIALAFLCVLDMITFLVIRRLIPKEVKCE